MSKYIDKKWSRRRQLIEEVFDPFLAIIVAPHVALCLYGIFLIHCS